jgi:UDP-N-acetylmuramoylalanine-D-glutamate ligase
MQHYVETKARIFAREPGKICVIPLDSEYFSIFYTAASA